jgi:hypothetical protein
MASLNFPANPTVGQVYTSPSGIRYQWNGTTWITYATSQLSFGPTGPTGATGQGLPQGGASGQVLGKTGPGDYEWAWIDGGGNASVTGGNKQIQFNNNGVLGGATGFNFVAGATNSVESGFNVSSRGTYSHAEGYETTANGASSHTEGFGSTAIGRYSHAEGGDAQSGVGGIAIGDGSHAEGTGTTSVGISSHAEGGETIAIGDFSHAEGITTRSVGTYSHAEGVSTTSVGFVSHSEGDSTTAIGIGSHSEGYGTIAKANYQTVVGKFNSESNIQAAFIIGGGTADNQRGNIATFATGGINFSRTLFINGVQVLPSGAPGPTGPTGPSATSPVGSVGMPQFKLTNTGFGGMTGFFYDPAVRSLAIGTYVGSGVFAQGLDSLALGTECLTSGTNAVAMGQFNQATADYSMAIGRATEASGQGSMSQGEVSKAIGGGSHAEGENTTAAGDFDHSEGTASVADGYASHAEGFQTTAKGPYNHSEGEYAIAIGVASHAEGTSTTSVGSYSHSEGMMTTAKTDYSHAEGVGTITGVTGQTVVGKYNTETTAAWFVVGGGTGNSQRSNIATFGPSAIALNRPVTISGINKSVYFNDSGTLRGSDGVFINAYGLDINNTGSFGTNTNGGNIAFTFGQSNAANAFISFVEGASCTATGTAEQSHAEGQQTTTKSIATHSGGIGTIAAGSAQWSIGAWNIENGTANFSAGWRPFIVGIGSSNTSRRTGFEVVSISRTSGAETGTIVLPAATGLNFASDVAAAAGNVPVGGIYHNAGAVRIRLS